MQFFSWRQAVLKSSLPATTRHVLLTLACHMNDAGESCYPSIALLVDETGLSKQSVITHLDKAEQEGWIVIEQHGFRGQKWKRNEYRIAWPKVPEGGEGGSLPSPGGGQPPVPPSPEGGQPNHQKVVKEVDLSTSLSTSKTICTEQTLVADPVRFDGKVFAIDDVVFDSWILAYSAGRPNRETEEWIEAQLTRAELWLQANPRKRKKNYLKFLTNWLSRASDQGRRRQGINPNSRAYH